MPWKHGDLNMIPETYDGKKKNHFLFKKRLLILKMPASPEQLAVGNAGGSPAAVGRTTEQPVPSRLAGASRWWVEGT